MYDAQGRRIAAEVVEGAHPDRRDSQDLLSILQAMKSAGKLRRRTGNHRQYIMIYADRHAQPAIRALTPMDVTWIGALAAK